MAELSFNEPYAIPRRRDPASTQRKLLAAARLEFARNGLAGARVDDIAARAGVNKQLVYHYFGDKDALYFAVLQWMYHEIRDYEQKLCLDGLNPDQTLRKLILSTFDYLVLHPDFVSILNDENRNDAAHVRNLERFSEIGVSLLRLFSRTLNRGVRDGLFRRGVNPEQLYISIAALSYFYVSGRPTLSVMLGKDLSSKAALRQRRRHIVDFVMKSLRP